MVHTSILTEEFVSDAKRATREAREAALRAGQAVVFVDSAGRYVEERPDGRLFEVQINTSLLRESQRIVVRELSRDEM